MRKVNWSLRVVEKGLFGAFLAAITLALLLTVLP